MRIDQVMVGAAPGDAITNIALNTRSALRDRGAESELYAWYLDPAMTGEVASAERLAERPPELLLVHTSIGCAPLTDLLLGSGVPLILVHHNITPSQHFAHDPAFARLLDEGRREVASLRPHVRAVIADSAFNADDVATLGYREVTVVAPMFDPHRLASLEPDPVVSAQLAHAPLPAFSWVAQMLPHKRPDLALAAQHILASHLCPDAQMYLIGPQRQQVVADHVRRYARSLELPGAALVGQVSENQLAAFLRRSTALLITSDHEGFCLPAIEAMALGIPVIARDRGALRETTGGAALFVPEPAGPRLLAAAMHELAADPTAHSSLVEAGARRATALSLDRNREAFLEVLERLS